LANPDPEIDYATAMAARKDIIMATGRSDNPNQVNNVLGFPFIFRGALDVRATKINEAMKLAAVHAIAGLAKESVPEVVNLAYGERNLAFGPTYLIPKPFDPRLIYTVAPAIARAAMESGVAQKPITDWLAYEEQLRNRLGRDDKFVRLIMQKARSAPKRLAFNEADTYRVLKAAQICYEEGIAEPILLGDPERIAQLNAEYHLGLESLTVIDPRMPKAPNSVEYAAAYYKDRQRRGISQEESRRLMRNRDFYGPMMVKHGHADAYVTGSTTKYSRAVKPVMEILGPKSSQTRVAGMYIMLTKRGPMFFADTTLNEDPSAEQLAQIVSVVAQSVKRMNIVPKVALLSFSNFGSHRGVLPTKMRKTLDLIRERMPDLIIDGEMQANFAVDNALLKEMFPFSELVDNAPNVFIFPGLASGNISYKLLQSLAGMEAIGPLLTGLDYPAHVLQMGSSVREIVNTAAMAVVDAQTRQGK
jgi:malate dehydrogenase (oxaloacetate-decarboxylating)(NADP+)